MSVALARCVAAKPHLCDAERLVSAYNLLKDDDRCSHNSETIDAYLHVRISMPVLAVFNVRPAVQAWFRDADRRNTQLKDTELERATSHEWFKGVF